MALPDRRGYFGAFGGRFVPETLHLPLAELTDGYRRVSRAAAFRRELTALLASYAGRPTPLFRARRFGALIGASVYLKREDLAFTGSHKINNTLGQALLARRLGKTRLIAETGAGQHGVATATAAALLGMTCRVYMGEVDCERQRLNVYRMRLLGAEVVPVRGGSRTLKDAINEAMRDWTASFRTTHYLIGSVMGPHPYPGMVRDFQSVIGREARRQILSAAGRLPDCLVACVGGGSNSIGLFHPFLSDAGVALIGVEAAGAGLAGRRHAATLLRGSPGVLHGSYSYLLQDGDGQVRETHSVSAGLDYPGVGPEHSHLRDTGRARYEAATDADALRAFHALSETEGITPALESAHALGWLIRERSRFRTGDIIVICLSGRGDKDVAEVQRLETRENRP